MYIYTNVLTCLHVYTHIHMHKEYILIYTRTSTYISIYRSIYIYIYIYIWTSIQKSVLKQLTSLGHSQTQILELKKITSDIGMMVRVFANGLGDRGSIPGQVIPKTKKNASLLNTQQYKVGLKGKVEQSKERSSALPYTLV